MNKIQPSSMEELAEKANRLVEAMGQEVYDDLILETCEKLIEEDPCIRNDAIKLGYKSVLWMHEVYIEKQLN